MNNTSSLRFKKLRKELGLTQVEIASLLEVSQGTITDIERGKVGVSKRVAEKLKEKAGINTGWILSGDGNKHSGKNTGFNTGFNRKNTVSDDFSIDGKLAGATIHTTSSIIVNDTNDPLLLSYHIALLRALDTKNKDLLNLQESIARIPLLLRDLDILIKDGDIRNAIFIDSNSIKQSVDEFVKKRIETLQKIYDKSEVISSLIQNLEDVIMILKALENKEK